MLEANCHIHEVFSVEQTVKFQKSSLALVMEKKSHLYYSNNIFIYEESGKPAAGFCSSNSLDFAYLKKKVKQKKLM